MGIFRRDRSPYWWLYLELTRKKEKTPFLIGTSRDEQKASRADAEALYHKRMSELGKQQSGLVPAPPTPTTTFNMYADWYDAHVIAHHAGAPRERDILEKQLRPRFGTWDLTQITKDAVTTWRSERATATSKGNAVREFALLRRMLNVAVPTYLEVAPVWRQMPKMVPDDTVGAVLSIADEVKLFGTLEPLDRAFILCALDTILRQANVRNLRRTEDKGTHLEVVQKRGRRQSVPVSSRLRAALDAIPNTGPYYFPHRRGHADVRNTHRMIARMLYWACKRVGIPYGRAEGGITFHSLRHTGATRMGEAGMPPRTLQDIGGWKTLSQVQRYTHVSAASKVAAVEAIGAGVPVTMLPRLRTTATSFPPRSHTTDKRRKQA